MKFPCASCGVVDDHDDPVCGACGGAVTGGKDIVKRGDYEQTPPQKSEPGESDSVIIPSPDENFARALIGQHQQIILKSRRAIDDIRKHFGLKE